MKRFLQIATVLACSAVASWAGPSIVLSGNTSFTVNYNAFDEGDNTPFPLVNSSVLYTVSNWTTGTDSGSNSPFSTGTKFTSFKMTMDISNTSTVQSLVTSLGWVTNPDIEGTDSSVSGIWDEFNDNDPANVFTPDAEFCLASYDDICNSGNGVANGKKGSVSATMFFIGHGSVTFQNFLVRYQGMEYEVGTGKNR
ncbi:cistern family PEP-CTERM protein, partial [Nostoc sp. NIES-2111]